VGGVWAAASFLMADQNLGIGSLRQIATVRIRGAVARDDALAALADKAVQEGWAKPGYAGALIAREAAYPTGLHAAGLDIAIPHADAEWTLVPSMIIGILEEPALFQPMGGQGPEVRAHFILLLVIPDPDTHVDFLRALSGFIQDESRLEEFGRTQDISLLTRFLRAELEPPAAEAATPSVPKA
jgi:galactitol PTS system EIIA component